MVASQFGTEQLLGVPALSHGTGKKTAEAVFKVLNDWNIANKTQAICFDTTNVNTGIRGGAATILEMLMKRTLLWLPHFRINFERCFPNESESIEWSSCWNI